MIAKVFGPLLSQFERYGRFPKCLPVLAKKPECTIRPSDNLRIDHAPIEEPLVSPFRRHRGAVPGRGRTARHSAATLRNAGARGDFARFWA